MKKKTIFKNRRFLFTALIMLMVLPGLLFCQALRQAGSAGWQIHSGEPVVRLHVRAAGDSPAEQGLKMAVAAEVQRLLSEKRPPEVNSQQLYLDFLHDCLPELECFLREFAVATAEGAQIELRLTEEIFPLRTYGRRIYPAGNYTALTVTIGEGAGENWWCLLFPSLCLPPAVFDHGSVEEEQIFYGEKEESSISTGVDEAPDFAASRADGTKQAAGSSRWGFKLWKFVKRPGQHLIEKAAQIFYN